MDTAKPAAPVTVPFHSKDTGENEKTHGTERREGRPGVRQREDNKKKTNSIDTKFV